MAPAPSPPRPPHGLGARSFGRVGRGRSQVARLASLVGAALCIACGPRAGTPDASMAATPRAIAPRLARAHAHNDYVHARPLLDALERGFGSIEADVHLVDGALLVAHDRDSVSAGRTLERLYLAPLRAHFATRTAETPAAADPLLLLIDVKSDAESTYAALDVLLRRYDDVVTAFVGDSVVARPVLAVLSGNRAITTLQTAPVRHVALDGRLPDLYRAGPVPSPTLMPLVSEAWDRVTSWKGRGAPPPGLRDSLTRVVARAHASGFKLRFWGTPDRRAVWTLLRDVGVDLINGDDLDALRAFLVDRPGRAR